MTPSRSLQAAQLNLQPKAEGKLANCTAKAFGARQMHKGFSGALTNQPVKLITDP
jgi:hypothetical protein